MPARSLYFTGPGEVSIRERPIPEPSVDEVRVRTVVSAISSGTETCIYRGEAPTEMAVDETIDALGGTFEFPFRYGYAAVGEVTAVGDEVPDDWLGRRAFAFNPHESHFTVEPDDLVPIPENWSAEQAAFLPNVECAVNFVMDGRPMVGERVTVLGQGVVGLLTTALLARHPLASLVTVDLYAHRRDAGERLGADEALDPNATDIVETLREKGDSPGIDLAYELTGDPDALDEAIDVMGYDGRLVVGGWYGSKSVALDLGNRFHRNRGRVISSQVSTVAPRYRGRWSKDRRLRVALNLLGEIDPTDLVTHRIPFTEAASAYALLDERPDEAIQVLLTYE